MKRIRIISGGTMIMAELNDSLTASGIAEILPLKGRAIRWGKEIYFSIPFSAEPEDPQTVVCSGDLAYWPPGRAFCIFWGTTPASLDNDEIRPASEVNIVGRIVSGLGLLEQELVNSGDPVVIEPESDD